MIVAIRPDRHRRGQIVPAQGMFVDKVADTPPGMRGCVQGPWHRRGMTTHAADPQWCSTCRADVLFEQPGCLEEHGADCPEWVCVQCGDAVLVGFALLGPDVLSQPSSSVA